MSTYIKGPALIQRPTVTLTSTGTLTLTKDSTTIQVFNGTNDHTVVLPDATTIPIGRAFDIYNESTGEIAIQDDDLTELSIVDPETFVRVVLTHNSANEGTWVIGKSGASGGVDSIDTEIGDLVYTYSGFSARFNEMFTSTSLRDTLDKIIKLQYTPPTISLTGSSNVLREKGDIVSSVTLTANVGKRSDPIDQVRFYRVTGGLTLLDTQNSGGSIPNGGNSTYSYNTPFSDNMQFRAEADDDGSSGGPTTVNATVSYQFVYPYYVGAGSSGLTPGQVASLTKRVITSTASRQEDITATAGQVLYFAYPASYGALSKIFDVNNFDTISDWTRTTDNITGLDGNPVSYYIYEFKNPVVAGTYRYTFAR